MKKRIAQHISILVISFLATPWTARGIVWYVSMALGHGSNFEPISGAGPFVIWFMVCFVFTMIRLGTGWFLTGSYDD